MRAILRYLLGIPFVRDVLTLQAGGVIGIGISLLTSILYARLLGLERYGTYAIVLAFTGTIGIVVNWGQGSSMTTFFAEEYGKKNREGMANVLAYFWTLTLVTGILTFILAWASPLLAKHMYGSADIGSLAVLSFIVLFLNAIPTWFFAILQTVREIKLLTILDQSTSALHLGLSAFLLLQGYGIASIFLSKIALLLLSFPVFLLLYKRLELIYVLPRLRDIVITKFHAFSMYLMQGLWIGLDKNIGNLYPNIFFVVASTVATPATIGIARIAFQLAGMPRMFLLSHVNQLAVTVLATVSARGIPVLRQTCVRLLKHALFFHAALSFAALIVTPIAIPLLFGHQYSAAIPMALWLILITILSAFNVNNTPLLRLFRKTYVSTFGSGLSIACSTGMLYGMRDSLDTLSALILATFIYFLVNQIISVYIYLVLLHPKRLSTP